MSNWFNYYKAPATLRFAPVTRKAWAAYIAVFVVPAWIVVGLIVLASTTLGTKTNAELALASLPVSWLILWSIARTRSERVATPSEVPSQWGRHWGMLALFVIPGFALRHFNNFAADDSSRWVWLASYAGLGGVLTLATVAHHLRPHAGANPLNLV